MADGLDAWWQSTIAVAYAAGLITDLTGLHRPCTGRLVTVDLPGGQGPVATLMTEFDTSQLAFDQAIRFLDPKNWTDCSDFWCKMDLVEPTSTGALHYHEEVSTDCGNPAAWAIAAELDFTFGRFPPPRHGVHAERGPPAAER